MFTKSRVRMLLVAVIIGVWFVLGAIGGPTFGKISGISSNDLADFLPANAESTQVQALQAKFGESRAIPAVVLLESTKPLNPVQIVQSRDLLSKLKEVDGVSGPVLGPVVSKDKKAVQFIVPLAPGDETHEIVKQLQAIADNDPLPDTRAYVTGPAGLSAALTKAFGGIDGILLIVALSAVFIILLVVYRSLLLPFLVLLNAVLALCAAIAVVYLLAKHDIVELNGQGQGILSILVIGAATDYSLLLVSRYREAFRTTQDTWEAIWVGLKRAFEPILASAATVILALFCLLVSDLNSNRSLGPIAATGIVFAFFLSLTFLPAALAIFGYRAFWPSIIKEPGKQAASIQTGQEDLTGVWRGFARAVAAKPRTLWIVIGLLLGLGSLGLLQLKASGVSQTDLILSESKAVDGQKASARHFSAGVTAPTLVAVPESSVLPATQLLQKSGFVGEIAPYTLAGPGVSGMPIRIVDGKALLSVSLTKDPYAEETQHTIQNLRTRLHALDPDIQVGGTTALSLDTTETARKDMQKIVPLVLVVIFIVLALLLRALLMPLLLILTVVLSFSATLGISALLFNHVFHFPGSDAVVPLFAFIFLVALGIDYNIFLITRTREEAFKYGTRPAILHSLGKTGVVITSAGIVLAATFAALGIIPILFLAQIAFLVAFGVLIDTVIVRSLLVPALIYDIGPKVWWPSRKLKK